METPGPTPKITLEDVLDVFAYSEKPGTPLTSSEVAEELECTRRTAHRKLEELADAAPDDKSERARVFELEEGMFQEFFRIMTESQRAQERGDDDPDIDVQD
jgi:DNA-binding IclR family transcriptional regulator